VNVRPATTDDAPALCDIYRPAVTESTVSFEEEPPDAGSMADRVEETTAVHPWLVAERDGEVAGYAYAGTFNHRAAYRWSVTTSVYVARDHRRVGVARRLYEALFDVLTHQGMVNAYALITVPNPPSVALHESLGFELVGRFGEVGFKHGGWRDVAYWHRRLRDPPANPPEPVPFGNLREDDALAALLS
jgi:phosphinothricin acetyltransferase